MLPRATSNRIPEFRDPKGSLRCAPGITRGSGIFQNSKIFRRRVFLGTDASERSEPGAKGCVGPALRATKCPAGEWRTRAERKAEPETLVAVEIVPRWNEDVNAHVDTIQDVGPPTGQACEPKDKAAV